MTSAHQQLLLQALAHKNSSAVNTDTQEGFRSLVAWLEHTQVMHPILYLAIHIQCSRYHSESTHTFDAQGFHLQIRHYATEDRKGLSDIASERWPAAFAKVCELQSCNDVAAVQSNDQRYPKDIFS